MTSFTSTKGGRLMGNWFTVLCVAFCLLLVSYVMSNRPLPRSGSLGGLWVPSTVSILGLLICLWAYFYGWVMAGNIHLTMVAYTLGAMFDCVDGKMGRRWDLIHGKYKPSEDFLTWFFHPGTCSRGALVDSTCDKIKVILIYTHAVPNAGWTGIFLLLIVFTEGWAGWERLAKFADREMKPEGNHSGEIGKIKTWVHQLCLIPLLFRDFFGDWVLGGCLLIGWGFSLGSIGVRKYQEKYSPQKPTSDIHVEV